ncbi:hypothetical protein AAC387_Pa04g2358 [Persea americana]
MMSFDWIISVYVMVFVIQSSKIIRVCAYGRPCWNNHSNWVGIGCLNSHVVHIVLEGIQLTGSLPPMVLHNITLLSKLSLKNNSLFGSLPNLANLNQLQSVSLSNNRFTGSIPLEFIDLPNLSQLELQENLLTGTVPPFSQPTLIVFNVSNNRLQGEIPETPVLLRFPESSYNHNLELCGKPLRNPCPAPPVSAPPSPALTPPNTKQTKDKKLKIWSIALIAVAAALVPFTLVLVFLCYYRKMKGRGTREDEHSESSVEWTENRVQRSKGRGDPEKTMELQFFDKARPIFDLDDLLRASAELMGQGRLGSTYKTMLESGLVVTVKRLKEKNGLSRKEFIQQMQLLGNMRHDNLVEILSIYNSKEEKLVIYEYVQGGSLFELLHDYRGARMPLDWAARLSIAEGVARGLAFLHQSLSSHKVPHANLKSSNILIQNHYHPKLTDFGFQPLVPPKKFAETLTFSNAPEFSLGKKVTYKADVYCFGLILLELITGRIPGEFSLGNDEAMDDDLSEWVRSIVHREWSTEILDLEIVAERESHEEMLKLTEIALECTSAMPESRPQMSEVLRRIEQIKEESSSRREAQEEDIGNA